MSHPRLCLRTSLGDRAVSRGSPGPIGTHVLRDRRVSPYLVSREGVNGATRWLTVNIHRWVAKLAVDKTVGSSLTVLASCLKTGVSPCLDDRPCLHLDSSVASHSSYMHVTCM